MEVIQLGKFKRALKAQQAVAIHDLGEDREIIVVERSADELDQTGRSAEREFAILGSQSPVGARIVKKLVESIMPSTVFDGDGIPDWDGLLLSADSAIACTYNPRPEQKLAHHTENTRHEDQLPSARSQPQPHGLPRSLDSS